jgi:nucleotide-binding universal stress UspA family protein
MEVAAMLERIMVALDGSRLAEQTLSFASTLARAFDAEIVLLRVVETPSGTPGRALDSFHWRMERTESIAYLEGIKRRLNEQGVSVDLDVTAGRACEEILEMARAREVDLLVLASHGVGGLSEFRMASTAQKVVFAAETSVLIVPARESLAEEAPFETVLVPVDCTPHSDWAVTIAARLARSRGAELVVLHVVREPRLLEPHGTARERQIVDEIVTLNRGAASRYMEALTRRLESPDLKVRTIVDVAVEVAPVLERHATAEASPLLVLSARGSSRFDDGPYGGLVAVMLANTGYPVLVLREPSRRRPSLRRWSSSGASTNPRRAPLTAE